MTAEIQTTGTDRARQLARKVIRERQGQEQMAQGGQGASLDARRTTGAPDHRAPLVHEQSVRGFINQANILNILLLAMPLSLAAIAQTHAILVGYLDLSVGATISFGVVVGSFLIGGDATTGQILIGVLAVLGCGLGVGLVNAGLIGEWKIPSLITTLATLASSMGSR